MNTCYHISWTHKCPYPYRSSGHHS